MYTIVARRESVICFIQRTFVDNLHYLRGNIYTFFPTLPNITMIEHIHNIQTPLYIMDTFCGFDNGLFYSAYTS